MRIFSDEEDKMNLRSKMSKGKSCRSLSFYPLRINFQKGNRPAFTGCQARYGQSVIWMPLMITRKKKSLSNEGSLADMAIELINDEPKRRFC